MLLCLHYAFCMIEDFELYSIYICPMMKNSYVERCFCFLVFSLHLYCHTYHHQHDATAMVVFNNTPWMNLYLVHGDPTIRQVFCPIVLTRHHYPRPVRTICCLLIRIPTHTLVTALSFLNIGRCKRLAWRGRHAPFSPLFHSFS